MKDYVYIKLRIDLKHSMTSDDVASLVDDLDYDINDDGNRIDGVELIETSDY